MDQCGSERSQQIFDGGSTCCDWLKHQFPGYEKSRCCAHAAWIYYLRPCSRCGDCGGIWNGNCLKFIKEWKILRKCPWEPDIDVFSCVWYNICTGVSGGVCHKANLWLLYLYQAFRQVADMFFLYTGDVWVFQRESWVFVFCICSSVVMGVNSETGCLTDAMRRRYVNVLTAMAFSFFGFWNWKISLGGKTSG